MALLLKHVLSWSMALVSGLLLESSGIVSGAFAAGFPPKGFNAIDVLVQQAYTPLSGKRVRLITNHTGLAANGTSTIDLLFRSGVCNLVALFSPEHGIRGVLDSQVSSSMDEATRLPIYSLYGETQ